MSNLQKVYEYMTLRNIKKTAYGGWIVLPLKRQTKIAADDTLFFLLAYGGWIVLTLKKPNKNCSRRHFVFFFFFFVFFLYFYLLKKIRLEVSRESSTRQRIHTKYQV